MTNKDTRLDGVKGVEREDGPACPLARYAFGYSNQKPGWKFWAIHAVMISVVVYHFVRIAP